MRDYDFSDEIIPYKKKKKKKAPKKSNHKHKYEKVIGVFKSNKGSHVMPAKECIICGKVEKEGIFFSIREKENCFHKVLLNLDEVRKTFPDLRVVESKED